ncbi:MAG: RNA recognition motif domain-containing protein [Dehalococcoidia bacterium]
MPVFRRKRCPLAIQPFDVADPGDLLCVRVHNLPETAIEPEIRAMFLPYGRVVAYARPRNELHNHIGPTAYVGMARPEATAAVRALHGKRLRGEVIEVSLGALPAGWASGQRQPGSPVPRRTVTPQEARPGRGAVDA